MRSALERYFEFARLETNWRTEILAGLTTFVTMAYIIFVNPSILSETGMPFAAVTAATCLASALGCLLMGAVARYPVALAPGMGLNAYFTFAVVKGMGVPWQAALGAVFISGILFLILTAAGIRQMIVEAIPRELYAAVAVGIGLFIAFIGFRNAGIVVADPATLVGLGNLRAPATVLALFGLFLTGALMVWRVKCAMLLGVVGTTLTGMLTGVVKWAPQPYSVTAISATFLKLDVPAALKLGLLEIIFVFLFVDLFDNIGTLVAVGKRAKLFDADGKIPRLNAILTSDALATTAGSMLGTSTVVSYIESAAGVVAGGRSGVTAIVTGLLFVVALFVAPVARGHPGASHGARAHPGGRADACSRRRDQMVGSIAGDPSLSHYDGHPVDFFHRQRPRLWLRLIHDSESGGRKMAIGPLARLCSRRSLYSPFHLSWKRVEQVSLSICSTLTKPNNTA
jgi:AGZA family xanthine/uracil permease-like MFS transporter